MNSRACSLAEATRKVAASRSANTTRPLDDAMLLLWSGELCESANEAVCMRAQRIYRRTGVR